MELFLEIEMRRSDDGREYFAVVRGLRLSCEREHGHGREVEVLRVNACFMDDQMVDDVKDLLTKFSKRALVEGGGERPLVLSIGPTRKEKN